MSSQDVATQEWAYLTDGSPVLFRRLGVTDRPLIQEAFEGLSTASRYQRFFTPVKELAESLLRYLTEVDYQDHYAVLAVLPRSGLEDEVAGVARWVRTAEDPTTAELAVAVVDRHQNRGLGSALLERIYHSASSRGITCLIADVLPTNTPMRHLMGATGTSPIRTDDGVLQFRIPTGPLSAQRAAAS
ncbi:MAG: hypothetical protein NVS3B24_02040 [Candidatus Dormibacteria bacterium]